MVKMMRLLLIPCQIRPEIREKEIRHQSVCRNRKCVAAWHRKCVNDIAPIVRSLRFEREMLVLDRDTASPVGTVVIFPWLRILDKNLIFSQLDTCFCNLFTRKRVEYDALRLLRVRLTYKFNHTICHDYLL